MTVWSAEPERLIGAELARHRRERGGETPRSEAERAVADWSRPDGVARGAVHSRPLVKETGERAAGIASWFGRARDDRRSERQGRCRVMASVHLRVTGRGASLTVVLRGRKRGVQRCRGHMNY